MEQPESSVVMPLLGSVMQLSLRDQQSLIRAWSALAPDLFAPLQVEDRPVPVVHEGPIQSISPEDWIASLSDLPNREQLGMLEQALDGDVTEGERRLFEGAITELKRHDMPLAIESSVTKLAYQKPVFVVFGIVGILFGVWRFGGAVVKFFH